MENIINKKKITALIYKYNAHLIFIQQKKNIHKVFLKFYISTTFEKCSFQTGCIYFFYKLLILNNKGTN